MFIPDDTEVPHPMFTALAKLGSDICHPVELNL